MATAKRRMPNGITTQWYGRNVLSLDKTTGREKENFFWTIRGILAIQQLGILTPLRLRVSGIMKKPKNDCRADTEAWMHFDA
jgi:hypothetical protein